MVCGDGDGAVQLKSVIISGNANRKSETSTAIQGLSIRVFFSFTRSMDMGGFVATPSIFPFYQKFNLIHQQDPLRLFCKSTSFMRWKLGSGPPCFVGILLLLIKMRDFKDLPKKCFHFV